MRYQLGLSLSSMAMLLGGCEGGGTPITTTDARLLASGQYLSLSSTTSSLNPSTSPRLPHLRLIVTVESPNLDGQTLQATDVHLVGNQAFVSYNVAGATQMGAVDVINISRITEPKIDSSLELPNHDANAIYRHKKNVFVVGAVDSGGAAVLKIPFERNTLSSNFSSYALESYAGTDVVVRNDNVYITSGDGGGLEVFDLDSMTREALLEIDDARGVSSVRNKNLVSVVSGQPGIVFQTSLDAILSASFQVGGNSIAESKSTIESGKTTTYVSLGDKGWKILCTQNGAELWHTEAVTVAGLSAEDTVTNAVSSDDGLIFAANGQAGLYVYEAKEGLKISGTSCKEIEVRLLGSINFGEDISANHVVYKKGTLFVPAGIGGLKIVQVARPKSNYDFDDFDDDDDKDDRDDD